jgi:hypothetical protein
MDGWMDGWLHVHIAESCLQSRVEWVHEQSAVEYGREISTGERRRRRLGEVQR